MPFSWNQRLITVYIRPHYWILTSVRLIQGVSTYHVSLTSIFILSPHRHPGFPTARYPSGPALHSVRMSHPSHITTYPVHITALHKITRTTLCDCLDDWLTVHRSITLVDLQLDAQNSYLFTHNTLIKSSTCFEHYPVHLQEVYVVTVYMQPLVSSVLKNLF